MIDFKNKIIVVTGSSSGIGRALALSLASKGAIVVANYHSREDEAIRLLSELRDLNSKSQIIQADITSEDEISSMFSVVSEQYGKLDSLVTCAGLVKFQNLVETSSLDLKRQIEVNLIGTMLTIHHALPIMKKGGSIVTVSSLAGILGQKEISAYSAAKGGVTAFSRSCAVELAESGIRVNSISPGIIDSGIKLNNLSETQITENRKKLFSKIPLGRMGDLREIVEPIEFLLSDEASYITGQNLIVDGGWSISGI